MEKCNYNPNLVSFARNDCQLFVNNIIIDKLLTHLCVGSNRARRQVDESEEMQNSEAEESTNLKTGSYLFLQN